MFVFSFTIRLTPEIFVARQDVVTASKFYENLRNNIRQGDWVVPKTDVSVKTAKIPKEFDAEVCDCCDEFLVVFFFFFCVMVMGRTSVVVRRECRAKTRTRFS